MKAILILLALSWYFIQNIESKLYNLIVDDELYPYIIDKSVAYFTDYANITDSLLLEKIDDDQVKIEAEGRWIKSLDSRLPFKFNLRTQFLDKSTWYEGPVRLVIPDMCSEFVNPGRFWYNVTKLFTDCPAKEGITWYVEEQILTAQLDVPSSFSTGPWRGYLLFTQGLFSDVVKFGFMIQAELVPVV